MPSDDRTLADVLAELEVRRNRQRRRLRRLLLEDAEARDE